MVDCGHVTLDAGCGRGCRNGECGYMTPGAGSGSGCHHGDCGPVTPGIGSGRGSPWIPWMCEPGMGSLLGLLKGYPRCMVWERVTL